MLTAWKRFLLLLFYLSIISLPTLGTIPCNSGEFNLDLKESYRKLRNLLRAEIRWKREMFGEDFLRERDDLEFVCYENINSFALYFPTSHERDEFLESTRRRLSYQKRLEESLRIGLENFFSQLSEEQEEE